MFAFPFPPVNVAVFCRLCLTNLATLPAGAYLARLSLPDGSTRAAHVLKR